jgi:integrase/recombinase XerD
MVTKNHF